MIYWINTKTRAAKGVGYSGAFFYLRKEEYSEQWNTKSRYPRTRLRRVWQLDLLSYLQQYESLELVQVSSGVYSTRTNDSLKISHGKWLRWSTGVGKLQRYEHLMQEKPGFDCQCIKIMKKRDCPHCLHYDNKAKKYGLEKCTAFQD